MGYTLGYGLEGPEFEFRQEQGIFLFSKRPNRLRVPPNLLFNGYRGKSGRDVKFTTRIHLAQKLTIGGTQTLPLLYTFTVWTEQLHLFWG